jgi:hypothetical protein
MERKNFLRVSLCLGALGGARRVLAEETKAAAAPPDFCERKAEFARRLLTRFMNDIDAELDPPRRVAVMEARGRSCARLGPIRIAEAHKGDLDGFIADFGRHMGPDGLRREGNVLKVKYPTCYCPWRPRSRSRSRRRTATARPAGSRRSTRPSPASR